MSAGKAVSGALVGFLLGAAAGLMWGQKAKKNIAGAVTTQIHSGIVDVQVNLKQAAAAGLPQILGGP